jgi:DNA-binding NarL/FixJ family response regulator
VTVTRVAILSPSSLPREAWKALLSMQPGIVVAWEASGPEALVETAHPDGGGCVLLDTGPDATDMLRRLSRKVLNWRALVLVDACEVAQIVELIRAGAMGVITRDSTLAELVSGLVAAARGEIVLPGSLAPQVLAQLMDGRAAATETPPSLSPREADVLQCLAQGLTNKLIAQKLLLSVRTVEAHLRAIYDKLGVASRTEAVLWAVRHGDIRPTQDGSPRRRGGAV